MLARLQNERAALRTQPLVVDNALNMFRQRWRRRIRPVVRILPREILAKSLQDPLHRWLVERFYPVRVSGAGYEDLPVTEAAFTSGAQSTFARRTRTPCLARRPRGHSGYLLGEPGGGTRNGIDFLRLQLLHALLPAGNNFEGKEGLPGPVRLVCDPNLPWVACP